MDPIVIAAGTALVSAMATDAWQQARAGLVALWRRARPQQAATVDGDLEVLREQVLDARQSGSLATEQALAGTWQLRLQELLRADPKLAGELQQVLEHALIPALAPSQRAQIGRIMMTATAYDHARISQAGGDQYNLGS